MKSDWRAERRGFRYVSRSTKLYIQYWEVSFRDYLTYFMRHCERDEYNFLGLVFTLFKCFLNFWGSAHMWYYLLNRYTEFTYLRTYSMQQSPSWKANRFPTSQEIPRILRKPKVHYHIHKCPPPTTLSWASSIQSMSPHPTSWTSILILSSHLGLGLAIGLYPSGFHTKTLYTPLLPPYALHVPPTSFFSILSTEKYLVRSTEH